MGVELTGCPIHRALCRVPHLRDSFIVAKVGIRADARTALLHPTKISNQVTLFEIHPQNVAS